MALKKQGAKVNASALSAICHTPVEEEKITLVRASQLAGIHQILFQRELAQRNIPFHYDVQDFERDLLTISEMKLQ